MTSAARVWRAGGRTITLDRPVVVGIVNVTPDSFSDGGLSFFPERAVQRALDFIAAGADVLDIGGESTRPGAQAVPAEEELRRVIPVIRQIRQRAPDTALSIDTVKATVAEEALRAGVDIVNDVSGHRLDERMSAICAAAGCGVVLMHSRGGVGEMASYSTASYGADPVAEICAELLARAEQALLAGIGHEAIVLDPGIGFSKRTEHSVAVLRELDRVAALGFPLLIGVSRKRVIGELSGVTVAGERDAASLGANVYALLRGAALFRVHDVAATRQALDVAWRLAGISR